MRSFVCVVMKEVRKQPTEIPGGWRKVGMGVFQEEETENAKTGGRACRECSVNSREACLAKAGQ